MSNPRPKTPERITIFGFGAQGKAWALNLKDQGSNPAVFLRPGSERILTAREAGLLVLTDPAAAAAQSDIAALLLPDAEQPAFYREVLEPALPKGAAIAFAHGFAVHYRQIEPRKDLDVILMAPLAQGEAVRRGSVEGSGTPCVLAVAQDASSRAWGRAESLAKAVCGKGPFIRSTFVEEVESDLFAEQAVLCGGVPELARASFETLVAAGYPEEIAYFCCLRELRAIVELLSRHGIAGMRRHISDTARFGAITRGPRVIDGRVRETLAEILSEIRSGAFSQELLEEARSDWKKSKATQANDEEHPLERIHRRLTS